MLSYVPASGWPPTQPPLPPPKPPLQKSNSTKMDKNFIQTKDYKVPMAVKMKQFINPSTETPTSAKSPSATTTTTISSSIRRRSSMKWRSFRSKRPFLEAAADKREPSTNGVTAYCEDDDVISGKDRLLAILAAEKVALAERALQASVASTASNTTTSLHGRTHGHCGTVGESCSSSCSTISSEAIEAATKRNKNVFRRGVQSLRRSFRKAVKPSTATTSSKNMSSSKMSSLNPDFSHDSGLGDDSDTSHRTSPLIYNSLSSSATRKSSGSPTTPTPILRPTRSFSSGSTTNHPGLKHVMIREPSLRHLPSALRNSYPGAKKITTTTITTTPVVRLEVARHHLHRHSYMAENLMGGDVGPQWGTLYFRASQVVRQCLKDGCDQKKSLICDLIFCPKRRTVEDKLMVMEAEEVDETINLLYKILYFDWLAEDPISDQLPIILHCVQKFLVVVIEVCPELEASDRMRLGLCSKGLLKQCEDTRYQPLKECLARTRTLYIQVWCAILCIPFVP